MGELISRSGAAAPPPSGTPGPNERTMGCGGLGRVLRRVSKGTTH